MMEKLTKLTILLLLLATLSAIPGLPLDAELRGNWLQLHLLLGTPLAALLVIPGWLRRGNYPLSNHLSWWLISIALGLILIPMLGFSSAEGSVIWLEGHGWLSFLGVALLGWSMTRKHT